MTEHNMKFGWKIYFPDTWSCEYIEENDEYLFRPSKNSLTVHIKPFRKEKDGKPIPIEEVGQAYRESVPMTALRKRHHLIYVKGCYAEVFEDMEKGIVHMYAGIYTDGNLLSIDIFSRSKTNCEKTLKFIGTTKKDLTQ